MRVEPSPLRGLERSRSTRAPPGGTAPAVGAFVRVQGATAPPPLELLRPGGYDFARDMYFDAYRRVRLRCSAGIRNAEMPHAPTPPLARRSDRIMRRSTSASACLRSDEGAIASAVITGKRDAISPP